MSGSFHRKQFAPKERLSERALPVNERPIQRLIRPARLQATILSSTLLLISLQCGHPAHRRTTHGRAPTAGETTRTPAESCTGRDGRGSFETRPLLLCPAASADRLGPGRN